MVTGLKRELSDSGQRGAPQEFSPSWREWAVRREEQALQEHVGTLEEPRACLTASVAGLGGLWHDAGEIALSENKMSPRDQKSTVLQGKLGARL